MPCAFVCVILPSDGRQEQKSENSFNASGWGHITALLIRLHTSSNETLISCRVYFLPFRIKPENLSRYGGGLRAKRLGFDSQQGQVFILFVASRQNVRSTQPPIQWVPRVISSGAKRLWREADHSSPSSAETRKVELYLHSPICLHGIMLN
jgi:hypothetical protein